MKNTENYLLGIDLGTTNVKAIIKPILLYT